MDTDQLINIAIQLVANLEEVAKKRKGKRCRVRIKSKNGGVHIAHSGKFRHPEAHKKGGLQETIRQGPVCLLHWKNESPRKRAPVSKGDKPRTEQKDPYSSYNETKVPTGG